MMLMVVMLVDYIFLEKYKYSLFVDIGGLLMNGKIHSR